MLLPPVSLSVWSSSAMMPIAGGHCMALPYRWCRNLQTNGSDTGHRHMPSHGPLTRYAKLWVAHAPRVPGTFPRHRKRKPLVSSLGMHHDTCVTPVPWCMSGSLTGGWRGKRTRHPWRMRNPQFYLSGKRPMSGIWYTTWNESIHRQKLLVRNRMFFPSSCFERIMKRTLVHQCR